MRFGRKWLVAGAVFLSFFLGTVCMAQQYTVQKGDTLSQISSNKLGDWRKWEDLAKWNDLAVEWKDGVAYVWLKPGQIIFLEPNGGCIQPEYIANYYANTRAIMEKRIFELARIKSPWTPDEMHHINLTQVLVDVPVSEIKSHSDIRHKINQLTYWKRYLEHQSRYLMVQEIIDKVFAEIQYPFEITEEYWENHRKMCFLLLAILDIESDGYFAKGQHGERGPYQIKMSTYADVHDIDLTESNKAEIEMILMTSSKVGLDTAYTLLMQRPKSMLSALEHYNRSSDRGERRNYANRVLKSYRSMMHRGAKLDEKWDL